MTRLDALKRAGLALSGTVCPDGCCMGIMDGALMQRANVSHIVRPMFQVLRDWPDLEVWPPGSDGYTFRATDLDVPGVKVRL